MRPHWIGIAVDTGIEVEQRFRIEVVDSDKCVLGAVGDKRELRTNGRPAQLIGLTFGVNQLCRLGIFFEADRPDFILSEKDYAIAFG